MSNTRFANVGGRTFLAMSAARAQASSEGVLASENRAASDNAAPAPPMK
jgi:hypothetical protein